MGSSMSPCGICGKEVGESHATVKGSCGHFYHKDCYDQSIQQSSDGQFKCPVADCGKNNNGKKRDASSSSTDPPAKRKQIMYEPINVPKVELKGFTCDEIVINGLKVDGKVIFPRLIITSFKFPTITVAPFNSPKVEVEKDVDANGKDSEDDDDEEGDDDDC